MSSNEFQFDWLVVGSGFGGGVAALRLAEKGYSVAVIERGRRYGDLDLPTSTSDPAYTWAPKLGRYGIMRSVLFRHVCTASQTGVGGGSLMYGGVLFRAQPGFYDDPQWHDIAPWADVLDPHFATAEYMLGVKPAPWQSTTMALTRQLGEDLGVPETFALAPTGVFFGEPGVTVDDPYFGGDGPARTGCIRCGACMVGCRTGSANRLTKNYLWFAEKLGVEIVAEQEVVDVSPLGAADGSDGYRIVSERRTRGRHDARSTYTARGVVFAGGAVATNELLADCKHRGSLPAISDRLGHLVRTNSEAVLGVLLPEDIETWRDVTASSRLVLEGDTQVEFLTTGRDGNSHRFLFTLLTGEGSAPVRIAKWCAAVARHPRDWVGSLRKRNWSARMLQMLVMQPRDNALRLRAKPRRSGGYRLVSETDHQRPVPTYLDVGHRAAERLAQMTGGVALSTVFEAFANIPQTAHILGGAVIGSDRTNGVIDPSLRVFGYQNMIVCDGAAMPANPGVNPALTITALAEYALDHVPAQPNATASPRGRQYP